jgi:hypothetical protein
MILPVPGFQNGSYACLQDEQRVACVVFLEKDLIR